MKKLILIILIVALSGCATVQQSPYDLRDRMNSVRIGMTRQEVENLIGKPAFVTTHDMLSGTMEICDYTFESVNSANVAKSFMAGTGNGDQDLSIVVVYNNGVVLSVQRHYDFGSNENTIATQFENPGKNRTLPQSHQAESKQSSITNTSSVSNVNQSNANAKPTAGVHVNKDMIVTRITPDSPAYKAGLKINDIIVAFDGIAVADTATLKRLTDGVKSGDRKNLRVQRGSKTLDLTISYP